MFHRVYLAFAILGGGVLVWFLRLVQRARASRIWPATDGRIVSAQAQPFSRGESRTILVYYEYSVDGRVYAGKRLRFAPPMSLNEDAAQAELLKYRLGSSLQIHYNPAAPDDSVVETGTAPYLWYCVAGAVGFCLLDIALYLSTNL